MSLPVTAQQTWTREELEALEQRPLEQTAEVCLQLTPFLILSYALPGLPPYITLPPTALVDTFSFIYSI